MVQSAHRSTRRLLSVGCILGLAWVASACGSGDGDSAAPPDLPPIAVQAGIDTSATFSPDALPILRSSNYYPGVRSPAGHELYLQSFPDHGIVRINAFDWAAAASSACVPGGSPASPDYSACIAAFKAVLEQSKPYLDTLTKTRNATSILMVDIFRTPTWLSRSADTTPACGGGVLAQAWGPRDAAVWNRLLDLTVAYFKQYDSTLSAGLKTNTRVFYQFWNEPDLACNWQDDTPAFLALYETTATRLKQQHPSAFVGGPGTMAWNGRITRDGPARTQNLAFDLIDHALARSAPLDFVTWHYFSTSYRAQLIDGANAYRSFIASRNRTQAQLPLIVNEWLPQEGNPVGLTRYLAPDAANALLAMVEAKVSAQGGVPWQDYGPLASDQWGLVAAPNNQAGWPDATKKPIYFVYEFFDQLARTSAGLSFSRENILLAAQDYGGTAPLQIGERTLLVSKEKTAGCYRFAAWNRITGPEQGSVSFVASKIPLAELQAVYGTDQVTMVTNLLAAIRTGQPVPTQWTATFQQARRIHDWLVDTRDRREFAYTLNLSGWAASPTLSQAKGINRAGAAFSQDKAVSVNGSTLTFPARPEEVVYATLCGA